MAVGGATHLPPPRSGNSVAGGPRLLIRQALPAYLAANLHIWRPSHYPPPSINAWLNNIFVSPTALILTLLHIKIVLLKV